MLLGFDLQLSQFCHVLAEKSYPLASEPDSMLKIWNIEQ